MSSTGLDRRFRESMRSLAAAAVLGCSAFASAGGLLADDCNRNGVEDGDDLAAGTSADCNQNGFPDECEVAALRFSRRNQALTVRRFARGVACADLDGDGAPDVVTGGRSNDGNSTVSILHNDGDGRFTRQDHDTGSGLRALAVADLDADGSPDLVTAHSSTIELRWNDGAGGFVASTSVEVEPETVFVTTADVDSDGRHDIVAANAAGGIGVLLNSGSREIGVLQRYPLAAPSRLAVARPADIDADGAPDVVAVSSDPPELAVLWNDGRGAFTAGGRFPAGVTGPFDAAAADFDLDGALDVAVAGADGVVILSGDGAGGFASADRVPATAAALAAADLDLDGDPDLAIGLADRPLVTVLVNSAGRFLEPQSFETAFQARLLGACDLNGDRDLDLVVTSPRISQVTVLWNNDSAAASVESVRVGMPAAPHSATIGDLDGDGSLDYVTGDGLGSTLTIFLNDDSGRLVHRPELTVNAGDYLNSVDVGDFDGDGDLDVVTGAIQSQRMQVFLNDGTARLGNRALYATGDRPFMVEVAELTGDDAPEIISANQNTTMITVYRNRGDGSGRFEERRDYAAGRLPTAVAAGDLDGDGDNDLVVANSSARSFNVLRNAGDGTFGAAEAHGVDGEVSYVGTGDFDADGDVDVVVANPPGQSIIVFANRGDAAFESGVRYGAGGAPYSLVVHDMDVDGVPDVFTANASSNSVSVILNRGDGTFQTPAVYPTGEGPRFASSGDLDGDRDVDFVAANHDARSITVFTNHAPVELDATHLETVCTELEFHQLSTASRRGRDLKFMLPVDPRDPTLLPPLFQNGRLFALHQDFLVAVFPDRFPVLTPDEYNRLVGLRATRRYYIGAVTRVALRGRVFYGFSVFTDLSQSAAELLTLEEVRGIYETLRGAFHLEVLAYLPDTIPAREQAAGWRDPGFPVLLDSEAPTGGFEAYTRGVGYGTVRVFDAEAFAAANASGAVTFRDIIVLDHAPRDIEGVVSGVVTSEQQGPLSHLAVRTARRGTPNCFVEGAVSAFTPFEGEIVRLDVSAGGYTVERATLAQAQAHWEATRPRLAELPGFDPEFAALARLEDIDLSENGAAEARFGGKATNLARLERLLVGELAPYQESGFAIPMRHYLEFLEANTLPSANDPRRPVTYAQYLEEVLASEDFERDSTLRFRALARLRQHMEERGAVDPHLVRNVVAMVGLVFGSPAASVRFRSSSNVEDALEFNGAGLYSSLTGCAADEIDGDVIGPSRCDDGEDEEEGVARALRVVWASLWNFRAFEERAYYGIPQDLAAMAVLVTRTFQDELANGVAFTGNPANPLDPRFVITSQAGETSVVSPPSGALPARDIVLVDERGEAIEVTRASPSSLLPPGHHVLGERELRELSRLLWHVDRHFPIALGGHARSEVVLDFEFKIEASGALAVKQVRPFLRTEPRPPSPVFTLEVASGATACTGFGSASIGRDPRVVYELNTQVWFRAGSHALPSGAVVAPLDLIDAVRFGPRAALLAPLGPGLLRASRIEERGGTTRHRFLFDQLFAVDAERSLRLRLELFEPFTARGDVPLRAVLALNEPYIEEGMALLGEVSSSAAPERVTFLDFASCRRASLDLWEVRAELADGSRIAIRERFQPLPTSAEFGPVRVQEAEVTLRGVRRRVDSHWHLIYSAFRHNTFVKHWVVLDPPLGVEGLAAPVFVVEIVSPQEGPDGAVLQEASARYLGEDFEELASVDVVSHVLAPYVPPPAASFRRGDADADGMLAITDAVRLLGFLFAQGPLLSCEAAADADDDGALGLSDAVRALGHLFRGDPPLPPPFAACGSDPTADGLDCAGFPPCG